MMMPGQLFPCVSNLDNQAPKAILACARLER